LRVLSCFAGVTALTDAISGNGALLFLDMSNNNADSNRGMDYLGPAVAASTITGLNIASSYLFKNGGFEAIVSMLDNGALTSLNLSSNNLKAEGGKIVAEAIKVTNSAIAVVLVLFSCPSDHWFNCCCLLLSTG
jgi:hypothetical protein